MVQLCWLGLQLYPGLSWLTRQALHRGPLQAGSSAAPAVPCSLLFAPAEWMLPLQHHSRVHRYTNNMAPVKIHIPTGVALPMNMKQQKQPESSWTRIVAQARACNVLHWYSLIIFWAHPPEVVSKLGEPCTCRVAPAMQTPCMFAECVRCMWYAYDATLTSTATLHATD